MLFLLLPKAWDLQEKVAVIRVRSIACHHNAMMPSSMELPMCVDLLFLREMSMVKKQLPAVSKPLVKAPGSTGGCRCSRVDGAWT